MLTDYLVIEQDKARVSLYTRSGDHWEFRTLAGRENSVYLPSVDVTLALSDIYVLIEFEA